MLFVHCACEEDLMYIQYVRGVEERESLVLVVIVLKP